MGPKTDISSSSLNYLEEKGKWTQNTKREATMSDWNSYCQKKGVLSKIPSGLTVVDGCDIRFDKTN